MCIATAGKGERFDEKEFLFITCRFEKHLLERRLKITSIKEAVL